MYIGFTPKKSGVNYQRREFDQVMVIGEKDMDRLYESRPGDVDEDLIVYVLAALDQESILEEVTDALQLQTAEKREISCDIPEFRAYEFSK